MLIEVINCFCVDIANSGNKAAVITGFKLDNNKKQRIAKEINFPVTVFISNEDSNKPALEYFYPNTEMPLCLHGTIAAAKVLFNKRKIERGQFVTRLNNYELDVYKKGEVIQVKVGEKQTLALRIDIGFVSQMLNLDCDIFVAI